MATSQKKNQPKPVKPTLQMLNDELTKTPAEKRKEIQTQLGFKSEATVYSIINGSRYCKPHEQIIIAGIYGKSVDEICWKPKRSKYDR